MRLCFDCDGTITEGKFIEPPRTREAYMALKLYDEDTRNVWKRLSEHEIYIMTARSDPRADLMIYDYLVRECMCLPTAILTAIPQPLKWSLAMQLGCDVQIDDSPNVAETVYDRNPEFILMDNPHWKKNQEHEPYPYIQTCKSWKALEGLIEAIDIRKSYQRIPRT
jgi:hypothetical protein